MSFCLSSQLSWPDLKITQNIARSIKIGIYFAYIAVGYPAKWIHTQIAISLGGGGGTNRIEHNFLTKCGEQERISSFLLGPVNSGIIANINCFYFDKANVYITQWTTFLCMFLSVLKLMTGQTWMVLAGRLAPEPPIEKPLPQFVYRYIKFVAEKEL